MEAGEEQTAITKCGKKITWERNQEPQPESADHALMETETEAEKPTKASSASKKRTPGSAKTNQPQPRMVKSGTAAPATAAPATAAPASSSSSSSTSACRKAEKAAEYAISHVSKKQFGQGQCAKFVEHGRDTECFLL